MDAVASSCCRAQGRAVDDVRGIGPGDRRRRRQDVDRHGRRDGVVIDGVGGGERGRQHLSGPGVQDDARGLRVSEGARDGRRRVELLRAQGRAVDDIRGIGPGDRRRRLVDDQSAGDIRGGIVRVVKRGGDRVGAGSGRGRHGEIVLGVGDRDAGEARGGGVEDGRLGRTVVGGDQAAEAERRRGRAYHQGAAGAGGRIGRVTGEASLDGAGDKRGIEAGQRDSRQRGHTIGVGRG